MNAMKISENVDFVATLQCLRHSIMNEMKKIENSKISIVIFTSSIALDPLKPLKLPSIMKKHRHIEDYQTEIRKIRNIIKKYCFDSNCYIVGYSNIDHSKTEADLKHLNLFDEVMYYFTDVFDTRMFF